MSLNDSQNPFTTRPISSLLLAILCIILGAVSISGLIPLSPNHIYFSGHDLVLTSISWALALYFLFCWLKGINNKSLTHEFKNFNQEINKTNNGELEDLTEKYLKNKKKLNDDKKQNAS